MPVKAPLPGLDGFAAQRAAQQPPRVTFHGADWKAWQLGIVDRGVDADLSRQAAEPCAKDERNVRDARKARANDSGGRFHGLQCLSAARALPGERGRHPSVAVPSTVTALFDMRRLARADTG